MAQEYFNYNLHSHILVTYEFNVHDLGVPDLAALLFVLVLAEGNEGFQVIDFSDSTHALTDQPSESF